MPEMWEGEGARFSGVEGQMSVHCLRHLFAPSRHIVSVDPASAQVPIPAILA